MSNEPTVRMRLMENGPILVEFEGEAAVEVGAETVRKTGRLALCRCGHSKNMPFCDGAHKTSGYCATACGIDIGTP